MARVGPKPTDRTGQTFGTIRVERMLPDQPTMCVCVCTACGDETTRRGSVLVSASRQPKFRSGCQGCKSRRYAQKLARLRGDIETMLACDCKPHKVARRLGLHSADVWAVARAMTVPPPCLRVARRLVGGWRPGVEMGKGSQRTTVTRSEREQDTEPVPR